MKKATCIALAFALAVLFTASCGGGTYQAPPKANDRPKATGGGGDTGGTSNKKPADPERTSAFNKEAAAAQAAWKAFAKEKTSANFAACGAHIYNALCNSIQMDRDGSDTSGLRGLTELKRLKTDWLKSEGQLTSEQKAEYKADPEYKKAFEDYHNLQQD
ncbi:MAG: hypothetical protein H6839_10300 [Planctomycetes bacterium]|nr:hypothetical protein [Planctomycetota bacterium]